MVSLADVLDAVEHQESGGNRNAVSSVGARGNFQFIPATWKQYGRGKSITDPVASRDAAARYLTDLYKKHGSLPLALAAYNGGDGGAQFLAKNPHLMHNPVPRIKGNAKHNSSYKVETADYVNKIMSRLPNDGIGGGQSSGAGGQGQVTPSSDLYKEFDNWKAENSNKSQQTPQPDLYKEFDEWKASEQPQQKQPQSLLEATGTGVTNLPSSTWNMVKGLGNAIVHPIDTAGAALDVGAGAISNMLPEFLQQEGDKKGREMASQLADVYKQRYGTMDGFKEVLANDPASIMMDASMLAGGIGAGAKAANLPRTASLANKVAVNINPLVLPVKTAQLAGKTVQGIGSNMVAPILGKTTGAGTESIRRAAAAGAEGGDAEQALISTMRGKQGAEETLQGAKNAHSNMYGENSAQYKADLAPFFADKTVLDFKPIRAAMDDIDNAGQYKGVNINTKTSGIKGEIKQVIDEWEALPPDQYHTIEGLDSLKKSLGEVRDATEPRTPQRIIADKAYNAVKTQIEKQAPAYGDAMKRYGAAAALNKEISKALSLGDKAAADTAIRKLQSVMRNDANTNYGHRISLVDKLTENGAPNLMEELAGMSLNAPMPRGIAGGVLPASLTGASLLGGAGVPTAIGAVLTGSPRVVGELALKAGQAKRVLTAPQRAVSKLFKGKQPPPAITPDEPIKPKPASLADALQLTSNTGSGTVIKLSDGSTITRADRVKQLTEDKGMSKADAIAKADFEAANPAKQPRDNVSIIDPLGKKGVSNRLGRDGEVKPTFTAEQLNSKEFATPKEARDFITDNQIAHTHDYVRKHSFYVLKEKRN